MGARRTSTPPTDADLDLTAEMPAIEDPLASTDTWVLPATVPVSAEDGASADGADSTGASDRHAVAIAALEARGAELAAENERNRAELATLRERLAERDRALAAHEQHLAAHEQHLAAVEPRLAERSQRLVDAEAELRRLGTHVAGLERRIGATAGLERSNRELGADVADLKLRCAAYLEALQTREGERVVYESEWCALEAERPPPRPVAQAQAPSQAQPPTTEAARDTDAELTRANEQIATLETSLRERDERVETLVAASAEWRRTADELRALLDERDARLRRHEREAISDAVLLGATPAALRRVGIGGQEAAELAPDGVMRLLVRTQGEGGADVVHVLGRKTTVGRTPDNDLQIEARFISRHHAIVLSGPTLTVIEDLNSTNGVFVNGRRVTREALEDGDEVTIGKTRFRYSVRPSAERH